MFMITLVLDDPDQLDRLLEAWENAGIRGASIVDTTGIHRLQKRLLPMRYVFQTTGDIEESQYTLFAIVESDLLVQSCLQATEQIVGYLDEPNSSVFADWPLAVVKGLPPAQVPG